MGDADLYQGLENVVDGNDPALGGLTARSG